MVHKVAHALPPFQPRSATSHTSVRPTLLHTCVQEYLDKYEEIPFRVLRFLFTEINYGGRVTDDKDRRLINNLINTFCSSDVLADSFR